MALPEMRFLQAAIALADELNYSRAAARLCVEQSTLSKRIAELESQLDMRLFERNHQTVELTDAGRHFVAEARSAVMHAERAVADARAALQGADEVINIGRSVYADPYLVTMLQSIRLSLYPGLKIVSAMRTPSCHALREGAPLFGQTAHCQETREVADGRWFRRTMGTLIEPSKSGRLVAPMQSIRTSLCSTCGVESRPTERVRGLDQTEDVHGSSLVLI